MMRIKVGDRELEIGGRHLDEMWDSSGIQEDPIALKARLDEDGYLLIRGLQKVEKVLEARRAMLEVVEKAGFLHPSYPMIDGVIAPGKELAGNLDSMIELAATLGKGTAIRGVSDSPEIMEFFERFLGGPVRTFDYKWLRHVGPEINTGIHYDVVFMGDGTKNLFTVWCPFGDVPFELGGLIACAGSHKWDLVRATYGETDVYRDNMSGMLSDDPVELVEKFGGMWKTASYNTGDVVIMTIYTAHGSAVNQTNRIRVSMDTRYQLASDPVDERWMGDAPFAEDGFLKARKQHVSMHEARRKWGI